MSTYGNAGSIRSLQVSVSANRANGTREDSATPNIRLVPDIVRNTKRTRAVQRAKLRATYSMPRKVINRRRRRISHYVLTRYDGLVNIRVGVIVGN